MALIKAQVNGEVRTVNRIATFVGGEEREIWTAVGFKDGAGYTWPPATAGEAVFKFRAFPISGSATGKLVNTGSGQTWDVAEGAGIALNLSPMSPNFTFGRTTAEGYAYPLNSGSTSAVTTGTVISGNYINGEFVAAVDDVPVEADEQSSTTLSSFIVPAGSFPKPRVASGALAAESPLLPARLPGGATLSDINILRRSALNAASAFPYYLYFKTVNTVKLYVYFYVKGASGHSGSNTFRLTDVMTGQRICQAAASGTSSNADDNTVYMSPGQFYLWKVEMTAGAGTGNVNIDVNGEMSGALDAETDVLDLRYAIPV